MKKAKKITLSIIITIILLIVPGVCITAQQMSSHFQRCDYQDPKLSATYFYDHYQPDYPREEVSFRSGKNTLKGFIYGMDNNDGLIVFAHGIGSGHEVYLGLLTRLVDCGWRVFTYDASGCGYSDGDSTNGLAQSVIDLHNALSFAESDPRLNSLDTCVLGHSWGGYAAAAVLNYDHNIRSCVSMSGYYLPVAELDEFCDSSFGVVSKLLSPYIWIYNNLKFRNYSSVSAVDGLNRSGIPALIVHGNEDEIIGYNGASIIAQKDDISNPLVQYKVFSEPGRNGHNSYFYTPEFKEYKESVLDPLLDDLENKYGDDVPDSERMKYVEKVDKDLYNGFSAEVVSMIDSFFRGEYPSEITLRT